MRRSPLASTVLFALVLVGCGDNSAAPDAEAEREPTSTVSSAPPSPADGLCSLLETEPYEVRKAALQAAGDDVRAEVSCQQLVTDLETAIEIERTVAELLTGKFPSEVRCDESTIWATITNDRPVPIGVVGSAQRHPIDEPDAASSVGAEIVHWRVEPGETAEIAVDLHANGLPSCSFRAKVFSVDDRPIDASIPGDVADDDQSSDDPEVWFPALFEVELAMRRAENPNGVALTEDIRSVAYPGLVAAFESTPPAIDRPRAQTICRVDPGPDARHVSVIFQNDLGAYSYTDDSGARHDLPASTTTQVGVFRRGADGRWRWLATSYTIDGRSCVEARDAELGS